VTRRQVKNRARIATIALAAAILLILSGCGGSGQKQMSKAKLAVRLNNLCRAEARKEQELPGGVNLATWPFERYLEAELLIARDMSKGVGNSNFKPGRL
jgi:hypothetical protein